MITILESFLYFTATIRYSAYGVVKLEDENPIHTLGDYSRPSHEGYRNTIELPDGNNVVPLLSDTIRGPHHTQYCMENPEQAFIDYASSRIDEAGVGEVVTRLIFGVKEIDLGEEKVPYWTTLGKRESYAPQPNADGIGARPLTMLKRTSQITIYPSNGKSLEMPSLTYLRVSSYLEGWIDRNRPPKGGDGSLHAKIRLIDPDGEEITRTFQSIPTTRKLSEKQNPYEIIDLDHFHDS
nr:hypothetical protein [Tanacetum cinerariifolium]